MYYSSLNYSYQHLQWYTIQLYSPVSIVTNTYGVTIEFYIKSQYCFCSGLYSRRIPNTSGLLNFHPIFFTLIEWKFKKAETCVPSLHFIKQSLPLSVSFLLLKHAKNFDAVFTAIYIIYSERFTYTKHFNYLYNTEFSRLYDIAVKKKVFER